ncbi:type III polyketide synthase [Sphingobacterium pedocola]|uniref:Naringenin-chalcone synthase n=1 Tax=Sphingobacterium pedocola TaxID=2082722 RepID=A0ABR9TCB8_9SPHI|nr:type III polyketide synthase [Sphingobacterium pedocola]MBE8723008.1 naringenin-chalcone synthase [Sphingobacterium pedocola]
MSTIASIATAVPRYQQQQMQIFEAIKHMHTNTEEDQRKLRFMYRSSGIDTRYSVVPDFCSDKGDNKILTDSEGITVSRKLEDRLTIYDEEAIELAVEVVEKCLPEGMDKTHVTHLITVSCTGMKAPGLDIDLIRRLGLRRDIGRTSVNFMGCYAAIHGLKHAHYIAEKEPDAKVLLVCVELCTLHFQTDQTIDNVTSTIIFGDGAAAVLVEGDNSTHNGWRLDGFYSEINFEGLDDMAWRISADGFLMTLTSQVPPILERTCDAVIGRALKRYGIAKNEVDLWCVHPGGKKILEAIERGADITKDQLADSYEVLRDYGNMSSPTVLFVLEKMIKNPAYTIRQKNLIGMAFGPGLTLETFHLSHA